jgi:hypothetical protein
MRRRLGRYLPLVVIALLVQVFAPVGGVYAAAAGSDPLRMATICAGVSSGAAGTVPGSDHGGKCCAFCPCGSAASVAIEPPPASFANCQNAYRLVIWRPALGTLPVSPDFSHAQARAPPRVVFI